MDPDYAAIADEVPGLLSGAASIASIADSSAKADRLARGASEEARGGIESIREALVAMSEIERIYDTKVDEMPANVADLV